jgi:serine/threonine protein kinase
MDFVRKNTDIPVPWLIRVYHGRGRFYIVMDHIPGISLEMAWSSMSLSEKKGCLQQLKGYVERLQSLLPPHPGRVESVTASACYDSRLGGHFGPFHNVEAFHKHFGHEYILNHADKFPQCQLAFTKCADRKYRTMFTHGDLATHNILIHDGKIVAILDWEFAGWYPEYWEYVRFHDSNFQSVECRALAKDGHAMDVYPDELVVDELLASIFICCTRLSGRTHILRISYYKLVCPSYWPSLWIILMKLLLAFPQRLLAAPVPNQIERYQQQTLPFEAHQWCG